VKGEAFNVGGGPQNTLSLLELITWIEQKSGKKLDPPFAATRPGDQLIFIASTKKAEQLLGWRPTTSTKDGLEKLWGWIHENKALFA
jgi:CDP-paratose 2-epimerase